MDGKCELDESVEVWCSLLMLDRYEGTTRSGPISIIPEPVDPL